MAYPTILFNTSTGSDSLSSGAGPATAINGSGASLNGTTTVDLSADSPDLSGVATDGSACLWVQTSTGRQFSKITAVDNSTKIVTVETAYTVTESGRTWAIGGKRATWDNADSRKLFDTDWDDNWTIVTETDQTLTSAITFSTNAGSSAGWLTIKGAASSPRPVITQATSTEYLFRHAVRSGWQSLEKLHFKHSGATPREVFGLQNLGEIVRFDDCICGDVPGGNNPQGLVYRLGGYCDCWVTNCEIRYCTLTAVAVNWVQSGTRVENCYIHDNGRGITGKPNGTYFIIKNNIIANNGGYGITMSNGGGVTFIQNNVIVGHSINGIYLGTTPKSYLEITNNIFVDNAVAIRGVAGQELRTNNINCNCFYNNTTDFQDFDLAQNSVSDDPEFTDAANGNYSVGANLKAKGFPKFNEPIGINSSTYSYVDIGAAQRQESAAGGGVRIPNIRGGADQ